MRRILIPATVMLIILLALTACGGKKTEPTAAPAVSQPTAVAEKTAPAQPTAAPTEPLAPTAPPATAEPTAAPQPTAQPEPTAATAAGALPTGKGIPKSYVVHMEIKEEVVKPEASVEEWMTMEMQFQTEPKPIKLAMTMADKTGKHSDQAGKIISVEGVTYIFDPEENVWMKMPQGPEGAPGFDMGSSFDLAGKLAEENSDQADQIFVKQHIVSRHERVDGVDTTHYRLKDKQLDLLQKDWMPDTGETVLSGQVDFWIANKGDYLKQYTQDMMVKDAKGRQLHRTTTMLVTDENKPVHIEVPPEDQVRDMAAMMEMPTAEPTTTTGAGESQPSETSPEAAAFLDELPTPPKTQEVAEKDMPADMKFYVQMMGQQGPYRAYLSDTPVDEVRAFYNAGLEQRGFTSLMGEQAPEMGTNIYMGKDLGIQLLTQADEATGKTMIIVQVMGG